MLTNRLIAKQSGSKRTVHKMLSGNQYKFEFYSESRLQMGENRNYTHLRSIFNSVQSSDGKKGIHPRGKEGNQHDMK